ncbi:hypothetical protein [Streptomyces sp. NPDC002265]|uniref:hypothetical protein n=1 Tax=Streptomyces sp. NPDC002265 TaxID=3154415 RepID=UPI0033244046
MEFTKRGRVRRRGLRMAGWALALEAVCGVWLVASGGAGWRALVWFMGAFAFVGLRGLLFLRGLRRPFRLVVDVYDSSAATGSSGCLLGLAGRPSGTGPSPSPAARAPGKGTGEGRDGGRPGGSSRVPRGGAGQEATKRAISPSTVVSVR